MPWSEITPLLLTSVLATIPVALPATFTLAAALGARALAKQGVLPTRLSAVDEAATIDVLCSDKTGTLTANQLSVTSVRPMPGFDEAHVLGMAALASSEGGQDSVDAAIRLASTQKPASDLPKLTTFVPFDPAKKTSEATATDVKGGAQRIIKGAFTAVIGLTAPSPTMKPLGNFALPPILGDHGERSDRKTLPLQATIVRASVRNFPLPMEPRLGCFARATGRTMLFTG